MALADCRLPPSATTLQTYYDIELAGTGEEVAWAGSTSVDPAIRPSSPAIPLKIGRSESGMSVRDERGSLSELVAGSIGRRIVAGRFRPGETLPTEPRIQEEYGVSRTAVREAIRLLSAKGLTVSRPKIGTRIRPMSDWNMLDPDVLRWHVDQEPSEAFIHHLFEMREIIEPAAATRAAERATAEEVAAIGIAMDGIQNQPRGSPEQIKADIDFHMTILEASR